MSLQIVQESIQKEMAVALYFSAKGCNVCHALKPKLFDALAKNFSTMRIISIDIEEQPDIAPHYNVFSIPTLIVFLDSKEFLRKSRLMSIDDIVQTLQRPYEIMMS